MLKVEDANWTVIYCIMDVQSLPVDKDRNWCSYAAYPHNLRSKVLSNQSLMLLCFELITTRFILNENCIQSHYIVT